MVDQGHMTIEQAEAVLKTAIPLLQEARSVKHKLERLAAAYDYDMQLLAKCEEGKVRTLASQLTELMDELEIMGCYVKDLDVGLVDFLGRWEDRDVFYCWKLGEHRISHWHELDEGYALRQEILDLDVIEQEEVSEAMHADR